MVNILCGRVGINVTLLSQGLNSSVLLNHTMTGYVPVEQDLRKMRKTEIEVAGKQVMDHLFELLKNTDLSCPAMAERLNKIYALTLTRHDIYRFLRKNSDVIEKLKSEQNMVNKLRGTLVLDYTSAFLKDIRTLDKGIGALEGDEGQMIEPDKKFKVIADLIDKKGKLLVRRARLAGDIMSDKSTNIDKMQVNIYSEANEEKSELIRRLKKFEPLPKVIDVKPKPTDSEVV